MTLQQPFKKTRESLSQILKEYGLTIVLAIGLAQVLRVFWIETYRIPSESMRPTLLQGDTVLVSKWAYRWTEQTPARGEVVVFQSPADPSKDSIKRVIAIAGDTIQIKQGQVFRNQKPLLTRKDGDRCGTEDTLYSICWQNPPIEDTAAIKIPPGFIYVLGDLRTVNAELKKSKNFGLINLKLIKARVDRIWISVDSSGWRSDRFLRKVL